MGTEGKVKILEQVDGRGISPAPTKGLFYSYRWHLEANSGHQGGGIWISNRSGTWVLGFGSTMEKWALKG